MIGGTEFGNKLDGRVSYTDHFPDDQNSRLVITVNFGTRPVTSLAIVDTGAPWCILSPDEAKILNLEPSTAFADERMIIRGVVYHGYLYRISTTIVADMGEDLIVDATVFVADLADGIEWKLPNFLGLRGFLERIRFGIDPATNSFYFGAIDSES